MHRWHIYALQLLLPEYFATKFFYYSYKFHLFLYKNMTTAFFTVYFFQSRYTHCREEIQSGILYIYVENYYTCIYMDDSCKHLEPALVLLQQLAMCTRSDRRYRLFLKITRVQMSSDGTKTIRCTAGDDKPFRVYSV